MSSSFFPLSKPRSYFERFSLRNLGSPLWPPPLDSAPAASSSASLEMPAFFGEPPPNSTALDPRPSNSAELQALLDEKLALQQRMEELEMKLRS